MSRPITKHSTPGPHFGTCCCTPPPSPAIVNRQSPTTASQPSPKHLCTPSLSPTLTPSHPPFFPHFPHTLHAHRTHTHLIPLSPSPPSRRVPRLAPPRLSLPYSRSLPLPGIATRPTPIRQTINTQRALRRVSRRRAQCPLLSLTARLAYLSSSLLANPCIPSCQADRSLRRTHAGGLLFVELSAIMPSGTLQDGSWSAAFPSWGKRSVKRSVKHSVKQSVPCCCGRQCSLGKLSGTETGCVEGVYMYIWRAALSPDRACLCTVSAGVPRLAHFVVLCAPSASLLPCVVHCSFPEWAFLCLLSAISLLA